MHKGSRCKKDSKFLTSEKIILKRKHVETVFSLHFN